MKFLDFIHDNGTGTPKALIRRAALRGYVNPLLRSVIRPFFSEPNPAKWVFPVGCYNSGTTLTQSILAAHQDFTTLPREGVKFTSHLPQPEDLGWTRMWIGCEDYMERGLGPATALTYKAILTDWAPWFSSNKSIFMDKSVTNGTRMPWLDQVFPNSYFIGIFRNGFAASEGIRRKAKPTGSARRKLGSDRYSLKMAGSQWVAANDKILADSKRVQHFLSIQYEELISEPIVTLNKIWDFLEVQRPHHMALEGNFLTINNTSFLLLGSTNAGSLERLGQEGINELAPTINVMQSKLGY